jgi:hypothetical protein
MAVPWRAIGIHSEREVPRMAFIVGVLEGDFDSFKQMFDSDPLGRKQIAKGHTLLRGVDNPNEVFVRIEFDSVEEARAFRDKVRNSDVLQNMTVRFPPTVAEAVDQATY